MTILEPILRQLLRRNHVLQRRQDDEADRDEGSLDKVSLHGG